MNRVGESITGTVNRKHFAVSYSKEKWAAMDEIRSKANAAQTMEELGPVLQEFEALTQESYKDRVESVTPYLVVNPVTNRFFLNYKGKISSVAVPKTLADRIIKSVEMNIDPKPLIMFWVRLLRGPKFTEKKAERVVWYIDQRYTDPKQKEKLLKDGLSEERAHELSTGYQTPITEEGLLCTYKVSTEITKKYVGDGEDGVKAVDRHPYEIDEFTGLKKYKEPEHVEDRYYLPVVMKQGGDPFVLKDHTGLVLNNKDNHIIRVGCIHELDSWDKVNCNDDQSGVPGLHVGNLDYIRCYQTDGTVTHEVLVDPMDIGAVVKDGTGAIRCRAYFVYRSFQGATRGLYHSSQYARLKDAEYDEMVRLAVEKTTAEAQQAAIDAVQKVEEKKALQA